MLTIADDVGAAMLGHRLAQLRERSGMKQAELARRITWSQAVVSRIEAGERPVSDSELQVLLEAIGTPEASEFAAILGRRWELLPTPALDHPDQQLLWRAEQMAARLKCLAEEPDVRQAFERRLLEYVEEIRRMAVLLLQREHSVAFVGSIGIGKSTAICRATALEVPRPSGRPAPVLETGGGGVTLCEVHLREGPGYGIVIEPRTPDDIRVDVADFVDQLLGAGESPPDGSASDGEVPRAVPAEIERAIRNMTSLQPRRTKSADGKITRSDPAKTLAVEIQAKRELVVEILARMELHRRDRRNAWFDPAVAESGLEWLKGIFEQINNGRHPEFSLPLRIELIVPNLLEAADIGISIIDTRGIDQPTARADLEGHLDDEHTVSLLCSGFNDAPSQAVQHLLWRAREIGNSLIDTNCSVLVLARSDEALAVKDESGIKAETVEDGYDLKAEQISKALVPYKLDDMAVGFFNAFEDDPALLRNFILARVEDTRKEFRGRLENVLANAVKLVENAETEQVRAVQMEAGKYVASWVKQHHGPSATRIRIHETLLAELASAHPATVHAAVRRQGEWRSLSYSHQLGYGARRLAVSSLQRSVDGFGELCRTMCDSLPDAAELLSQADRLVSQAYDELLRKVQVAGQALYGSELHQDSQLWLDCEAEWGQGHGYRNRVTRLNRDWFEQKFRISLETEIQTIIFREWNTLLERLESIFETS